MGKQGELMEMMAKAKQERLKKELEEKLKESGDLPQERDEGEKVRVDSETLMTTFAPMHRHVSSPSSDAA